MFKLLIFLLTTIVIYANEYKILVITYYNPLRKDIEAFEKGLKKVKKEIENRYSNIKIVYTNVYIDRKKKNLIEKDIKNLKKVLKDRYLFIIAPGISKTFGEVARYLPLDTPIITAASTIDELKKYKGKVFSTGSLTKYNKTKDLQRLKSIINFNKIINVYDKTPGSYPEEILKSFSNANPDVEKVNIDIENIDKTFLDKYGDNALIFISANGTKTSKILIDRIEFILKNLEFLYDKNYKVYFYLPYFSTIYSYQNDKEVFTSSSVYSNKKNIFEYEYLQNIKYKDEKYIQRYDQAFRWYYPKILLGLRGLTNFDSDIDVLHRIVYNNLKKTTIDNPFIEEKTRYVFAFEQEEGIYFNVIRKYGILNNYLFVLSSGQKLLYPIQLMDNKTYHTVYITPQIKKLKILTLDATKAKIDMIVRIACIDENIELGKDILIESANKDKLDIKLLNISKITSFQNIDLYHKVYSVTLTTNINSKLFTFPYDEQIINIAFYSNNFSKNPIMIQMINDKKNYDSTISDNWIITKHFPTYSRDIYKVENGMDSRSKVLLSDINYLTIKIKRKEPLQIILKYFLPAVILLFLAIFISYFIFKRYSKNHIGIVSDVLLGIISIYFIYSLLIQIETLIVMDLIFYFIIFLVIIFILSAFLLEKIGYLKD